MKSTHYFNNTEKICSEKQRDIYLTGHLWLENTIKSYENKNTDSNTNIGNKLQLPTRPDGTHYILNEATGIQRIILYHVFDTIKKWINQSDDYVPFHRIVSGGGGAGKSYLIHQITTTIRKMFQNNDTVETAAFTGSAAYNIGGRTLHSAYCINCMKPELEASK